ncbi:MAG: hypothetical protein OXS32_14205, partial [Verrucomicrobiales bacterium]|nr:hypothetical protein [Verrucomicrobiales bacterium]
LKIVNFSGQTLVFGEDNNWLQFEIETETGEVVTPIAEPPKVEGRFTVESSIRATKRIDLAPYYALEKAGNYKLIAKVYVKQWKRSLPVKPVKFTVSNGSILWHRTFGLPVKEGEPAGQPKQRRYVLQQAKNLRMMTLYARVDDGPGARVHRVFPVCPMVAFNDPTAQVDPTGNLHILCQSGARTYNYTVLDPDGKIRIRHHYQIVGSRPRLNFKDGKIHVAGGLKLLRPDDIPTKKKDNDQPELILPKKATQPIPIIQEPVPEPNPRAPRR